MLEMSLQPTVAPIVRADTRSFPPTGQPLTIVNEASAGQASYGGGGGGGGSNNPNPVVSTLTFSEGDNMSGSITDGMIFISSILSILDLNVPSPQNNNYQFITNQLQSAFPAIVSQYQSTLNQFSLWGPSANQTDTGNLSISSDVLGRSLIYATNATGNLSSIAILADAINVPTGINVSSITASTISTSILTFPNSAAFVGTGVVMDTNLTINDVNNANQSDFMFVANQPEGLLGNSSTNAILINAPAGLGATLSLKAANNSTSMIIASDNTLALAPLELVASSVNISSLNVSSINGASPGGGGGLNVSTISVGGSAQTFYSSISTNSSAQISQPFDIAIGHYYNLKWDYSIAPTVTAGLNDYATFNFGGGLTQGHHTAPLAFSSITQGQLNFVANGNITTYLQVETNTTTPCELNLGSAIDNIILTDFGSL